MSENHSRPGARTSEFARNTNLEKLLADLNENLWVSEKQVLAGLAGSPMSHPVILVLGPMRSGTTLFMQWLANTGLVAYPTNLLSRFYRAPILGAKIQLLLTDPRFNFRDELGEFIQQAEYESENGKTKGVLAPNEFWYFWRRFLKNPSRDVWSDQELRDTFDTHTLKRELVGLTGVFGKPFAAKGMLFNYNIAFLNEILDKVIFIQLERDVPANAKSVLEARKRQLGSEEEWYSFQIPEYEELRRLDPREQVLGQIEAINRAVSSGLDGVAQERKIHVRYEDFCHRPAHYFNLLLSRLELPQVNYVGPERFSVTR